METGRSMGSDYWAALRLSENQKKIAIDDRPELMSSPINNPAYPILDKITQPFPKLQQIPVFWQNT